MWDYFTVFSYFKFMKQVFSRATYKVIYSKLRRIQDDIRDTYMLDHVFSLQSPKFNFLKNFFFCSWQTNLLLLQLAMTL